MSVFYLDYQNGLDSNSGASWALAWKTITSGATAARIAPGDIIRIAKSPVPTSLAQSATWTNLSKTVTLTTAVTANLTDGSVLTAGLGVTSLQETTDYKEGTASNKLVTDASVILAQKLAYITISETDFSSYQQISFWVKNSTTALTTGLLTINLCSDTLGDTVVNTLSVPAIPSVTQYVPITIDNAAALGSSIQSIAIYSTENFASKTVYFDNFLACKASSSDDALTLQSLISKNSSAQGGDEAWYGIQSINGTTVKLDNHTNTYGSQGRGYYGTTETVATYKRETIKTTMVATSALASQTLQDNGTSANYIDFEGGYNTATTLQDGETFFDGLNGLGSGLYASSKKYNKINYLNFTRYIYGIYFLSSTYNYFVNITNITNCNYGIYLSSSDYNKFDTIKNLNNNCLIGLYFVYSNNNIFTTAISSVCNNNSFQSSSNGGVIFSSSNSNNLTTISNTCNNYYSGIHFSFSTNNLLTELTNNKNNTYGIFFTGSGENIIRKLTTSGNTYGIYNSNNGNNYIFNASIAETTEVYSTGIGGIIFSHNHDDTADNHWNFTYGGVINSQTSIRHTASGIAWKMSPTNANRRSNFPLCLSVAKVAFVADKEVTVSAWMRRSNTGLTMSLVCRGGQIAGVASDVTSSMTVAADTWEEISIAFTPTAAGAVEIEAWVYGGTAYSGYVDDLSISQAT